MSVTVDIVLHAKAFVQSSELFDTLNVPKETRVRYMFEARDFPSVKRNWQWKLLTQIALSQSWRSKLKKRDLKISKLLFLSGAIVLVSRVCIEKYSSFCRTLNETCLL